MIEIQIVYPYIKYTIFPWKHNTFLAVYCTLLNKSYVFRYIFKEKQQNKLAKKDQTNQNGKKKERKKEGRKKERNEQDSNPAPTTRFDLT